MLCMFSRKKKQTKNAEKLRTEIDDKTRLR